MAVQGAAGSETFSIVTADIRLRFRRPTPAETPLTIRGRVTRAEEPNYFTEGEIVDPSGEVLTRAEARWRRLD